MVKNKRKLKLSNIYFLEWRKEIVQIFLFIFFGTFFAISLFFPLMYMTCYLTLMIFTGGKLKRTRGCGIPFLRSYVPLISFHLKYNKKKNVK